MTNDTRSPLNAFTDLADLAIDALATYRLTKLIRDDKIFEDLRNKVFEHHPPETTKTGYLLTCPWCLSIYFGSAVALGRIVAPSKWRIVARALALSALTGIMVEREESRDDGF